MNTPEKEHLISREIIAFLVDRRARNLAPGSIAFYERELTAFQNYLDDQKITHIEQITPDVIRRYLNSLTNRNAGGKDAAYRTLRAFFRWWAVEVDAPQQFNPMRKVARPKVPSEPLPGVDRESIYAMLATCRNRRSFYDARDAAIIITLFDTGLRRAEFLALNHGDINLRTGAVQVRHGKGDKPRTVFLGSRARQDLIRYLRFFGQEPDASPLWITSTGKRLTAAGLRQIIRRRAEKAGVRPAPGIHDFRRAFAIESLRNGMDLVTLARLMGHTDITVLRRYLHLLETDLQRAHSASSPADHL